MLSPAKPIREYKDRADWRFSPERGRVPGFSEFYDRFAAIARREGASVERFGNGAYSAHFGSPRDPLAFFMSGLHGDEQAGPLALLEWLEKDGHHRLLKKNIALKVIPLVNDLGWDRYTRNYGRQNLNRNFDSRAPGFLRQMMLAIEKRPPKFFLDLHEDQQVRNAYIFRMAGDASGLSEFLQANMQAYDLLWKPARTWGGTSEVFVRSLGCRYAATTETPRGWSLRRRIRWHCVCLDWACRYFAKVR